MKSLSLLSLELVGLVLLGLASATAVPLDPAQHRRSALSAPPAAPLKKRALDSSLGLSSHNLLKNTISIGFLPGWGEQMDPNNCTSINDHMPQPMAIVGVYVQVNPSDANMTQLDYFLHDILAQPGDLPVLNLALMPMQGFDSVTPEVANNIGRKMKEVNDMGLTVWLRYAHEMNGDWYPYAADPAGFQASWQLVADAVHNQTTDTYMLWAPNSFFANDYNNMNRVGGYGAYWPTDTNTVDIVGLSFYTYGGHGRLNIMPPHNMALTTLKYFDDLYGTPIGKPMVLAETGAAFTYNLDYEVGPGNATESTIKFDWLWQLLGPDTITEVPSLKAVTWFEVIKVENAGTGTEMKIEDFRLILGKEYIRQSAVNFLEERSLISNTSSQAAVPQTPANGSAPASSSSAACSSFSAPRWLLAAALVSLLPASASILYL